MLWIDPKHFSWKIQESVRQKVWFMKLFTLLNLRCGCRDILVITSEMLFDQDVLYKGIYCETKWGHREQIFYLYYGYHIVMSLYMHICLVCTKLTPLKTGDLFSLESSPYTQKLVYIGRKGAGLQFPRNPVCLWRLWRHSFTFLRSFVKFLH